MVISADDRGVAPVVGAVLIFGILIVSLSTYQAYAIPSQNSGVEFNHNQAVHSDLQELRDGILNTGIGELKRSVTIQLGTQFESRFVFVNPPDPSGSIRTEAPIAGIVIENATVVNENELTGDPSSLLNTVHETRLINYSPSYFEYDDAPTTQIEHSLVYDQFPNGNALPVTDQRIISGSAIEIILVDGNLSASRTGAYTVDPQLLSGPTAEIEIESSGDPITITFPSKNPAVWVQAFDETSAIQEIDTDASSVTITLVDGTYSLRMVRVGLGGGFTTDDDTFDIDQKGGGVSSGGTLPGPKPTTLDLSPDTVAEGEPIDVTASFDNQGTTDESRGGTPIVDAEWYIVEQGDPEVGSANRLSSSDYGNLTADTSGLIDTSGLAPGDYTVAIRAQDTRGVWTNESTDSIVQTFTVSDSVTFDVATAEITAENPQGVEEVLFEYLVDSGTDVEFTVFDENDNIVGSSGVISSDGTLSQLAVTIDSGSHGSGREPRPIAVEARILGGQNCSLMIESGDGDGPFDLCT